MAIVFYRSSQRASITSSWYSDVEVYIWIMLLDIADIRMKISLLEIGVQLMVACVIFLFTMKSLSIRAPTDPLFCCCSCYYCSCCCVYVHDISMGDRSPRWCPSPL